MRLAMDLDDMDLSPDVSALIGGMLKTPNTAPELLAGAPEAFRVCIDRAIAVVYCSRNPGTTVRGDLRAARIESSRLH